MNWNCVIKSGPKEATVLWSLPYLLVCSTYIIHKLFNTNTVHVNFLQSLSNEPINLPIISTLGRTQLRAPGLLLKHHWMEKALLTFSSNGFWERRPDARSMQFIFSPCCLYSLQRGIRLLPPTHSFVINGHLPSNIYCPLRRPARLLCVPAIHSNFELSEILSDSMVTESTKIPSNKSGAVMSTNRHCITQNCLEQTTKWRAHENKITQANILHDVGWHASTFKHITL